METLLQYGGALLVAIMAAIGLFLNKSEHDKRAAAEQEAKNTKLKVEDAKLETKAAGLTEKHKEVLASLADIKEAEKGLGRPLTPVEIESYWNRKK